MKGMTIFDGLLTGVPYKDNRCPLPPGFEPIYRKDDHSDMIRQVGWEKQVFMQVDDKAVPLMTIRLDRKFGGCPWRFRALVDFSPLRQCHMFIDSPREILEVFPIEGMNMAGGEAHEGAWRNTPDEAFEDVSEMASKAVRRVLDAVDRRHERLIPLFDIWAGEPASGYFLPDQESPHERTPDKVWRIADHVKGETFRDAVEKWAKQNKKGFVGGGVVSPVTVDGLHVFPDEESASAWILAEKTRPKDGPFNASMQLLSSKALVELPLFDIWMEGFQATGQSGTARLVCQSRGVDFIDAVRNAKKLGLLEGYGDLQIDEDKKGAFLWGCRLFGDAADANPSVERKEPTDGELLDTAEGILHEQYGTEANLKLLHIVQELKRRSKEDDNDEKKE